MSLDLSRAATTILPSFEVLILPTCPTFCIRLSGPVGLYNVNPPPTFTYKVAFSHGVTPSIGDVIKFLNLPTTVAVPSPFGDKS